MKAQWSHSWKNSTQARKSRKYQYNAPFHTRHQFLSVTLSKKLRDRFKRRAIPIRKGDEVQVVKGKKAGARGKVTEVDMKSLKVFVENQLRESVGGNKIPLPFEPSNLMIVDLNTNDKKRQDIIGRKVEKSKLTFTKSKKEDKKEDVTPKKAGSSKELESKEKGK